MKTKPTFQPNENNARISAAPQVIDNRWRHAPGIVTGVSESQSAGLWSVSRFRQAVSVVTPLAVLVLWEIAAASKIIDVRFFPPPSAIGAELLHLLQSGAVWMHTSATFGRILLGFVWGAVPGIVVGLILGISPLINAAIQPLISITFPIPKIVVLPLFLLVFGLGEESKVAIIGVSVFYMVVINTVTGVAQIPRIYLDVGRNFRANPWLVFRDIALPGALPSIFTGLRTGMGVALMVIVSTEFLNAKSGLGYLVWSAWSVFDVVQMYAGLVITSILGIVMTVTLSSLEKWLIPWNH